MRSDKRKKEKYENSLSLKNTLCIAGIILALGVIAFIITVSIYNKNIDKLYADLDTTEIGQVEDTKDTLEEASADLGKTVKEMENQIANEVANAKKDEKKEENVVSTQKVTAKETKSETKKEEVKKETKKEEKKLSFVMPVEGEIQKEYAKDKLVYSETLKEWVTHTGIDIKAEKTTVVKAAEEGTVSAIKNDPRYGITVIIKHENGYETRYANLLTAEFIKEGETVKKGQTIGTVGNTGTFEILDEPHLHFELLKNEEYLDPTSVIK